MLFKSAWTKALSVLACCVFTPESIFAIETAMTSSKRQWTEEEAQENSHTCIQNELYQTGKGNGLYKVEWEEGLFPKRDLEIPLSSKLPFQWVSNLEISINKSISSF